VESVLAKTRYRNFELIIVDNDSSDPETLDYLARLGERPQVSVLSWHGPFNFSAINNWAVKQARGEHIVFLNNDTEVISEGWLDARLEHSQRDAVRAVCGRLLYSDGRVEHAGVILG